MEDSTHPQKLSNFWVRFLTTAVLLPVVIWITWGGGLLFFALLIAGAYLAIIEYSHICGRWPFGLDTMASITAVALAVTAFYMQALGIGCIILAVGLYAVYVAVTLRAKSEKHLKEVIPAKLNRPLFMAGGTFYIGLAFASLAYLRHYDKANLTVLWMFAIVVCSDISAYIFGRILKGKKLIPKISPNKTWSGSISSIVVTFVTSYIVANMINLPHVLDVSLFGAFSALVAQLGDLLESALKRYVNVKDSGNLIPGHGGVLDRIDALMLVAIFTFVVCLVAGKSFLLI